MSDWQLTIDCHNPATLVAFWAEAPGYHVAPPPAGFVTWNDWYVSVGVAADELDQSGDGADRLIGPSGNGPPIWFQAVPESKTGKNRIHLDIFVGGGRAIPLPQRRSRVDARVNDLEQLGATIVRTSAQAESDHYYVVMTDPEGNEFCIS